MLRSLNGFSQFKLHQTLYCFSWKAMSFIIQSPPLLSGQKLSTGFQKITMPSCHLIIRAFFNYLNYIALTDFQWCDDWQIELCPTIRKCWCWWHSWIWPMYHYFAAHNMFHLLLGGGGAGKPISNWTADNRNASPIICFAVSAVQSA